MANYRIKSSYQRGGVKGGVQEQPNGDLILDQQESEANLWTFSVGFSFAIFNNHGVSY